MKADISTLHKPDILILRRHRLASLLTSYRWSSRVRQVSTGPGQFRPSKVIRGKEESMRKQHILGICLGVCLLLLGISLYAQMVRPTHDGTVWTLSFIHVKPGMGIAYDKYLASDWKKEQDALKEAGII